MIKVLDEIGNERARQIGTLGWGPKHDDEHVDGSLALVAACYTTPAQLYIKRVKANALVFADPWPSSWADHYDKRYSIGERVKNPGNYVADPSTYTATERRRLLIKAAALIVAEVERLDRAALSSPDVREGGK